MYSSSREAGDSKKSVMVNDGSERTGQSALGLLPSALSKLTETHKQCFRS